MATTGFMLLCDFASRSIGGKLNIMGIFDRLVVNELPVQLPHAYLVLRLLIDPSESGKKHAVKLEMVDSEEKEKMKLEGFFEVPKIPENADVKELKHDEIFPLYSPVFEDEGEYLFRVWIDDELDSTLPLFIHLNKRSRDKKSKDKDNDEK